jgi:hypothetical protein
VVSVPLTPNGMGIREAMFSLFLINFLDFSAEQVGAFVLISFLGVALRIAGLGPIIFETVKKRIYSDKPASSPTSDT